jgi:hypothetical protein
MGHTKEPWEVVDRDEENADDCDCNCDINATRADGWYVTLAMNIGRENARRIVACVNACEGIRTETLERSPLKDAISGTVEERDRLAAEVAELREALNDVAESLAYFDYENAKRDIHAILAKHKKGGAE